MGPISAETEVARAIIVPDHEMLRCIGKGSYGQVWLARNIMGMYRAVKVIFRDSFKDKRPFDREISGIRSFEPISRLHEGFVDVLHTGVNEEQGYFYYIMELADDQTSGQRFNPDHYVPNTLSAEVARRGRLSVSECLGLGIDLTQALHDLHQHGLVHRDVKPSNIVFVNGKAKLADIGLVAEFHEARSYVGTEGFIPPEGPGTAQADLFSLGKVLYEASTGMDRQDFPEIPNAWSESDDYQGLLELNEILLRACKPSSAGRYGSAWDMHADLLLILNGKSVKRLRVLERRMTSLKRIAGIAGVTALAAAAVFYQIYREWSNARDNRRRQISANVSQGNRAVDSGDLLGALPYFSRALQLERGDKVREAGHRLRIGAALDQCPKLTQAWSAGVRINEARFSPDGQRVLIAEYFGTASIWDYKTGKICGHPFGSGIGLNAAEFSPDGKWVGTASQGHTAIIWDAQTLLPVLDLPHSNGVFSIKFSPDGHRVVTACMGGHAYVWNARTGALEWTLTAGACDVLFADFSRDGKWIALATSDHDVTIWSTDTGQPRPFHLRHSKWVTCLTFSPDGQKLLTACDDHTTHIWDLEKRKQILPGLRHDDAVKSVQYSPDGRFILSASLDGTARLWRATDFQPIETNPVLRHDKGLWYASFSPDGRLIITGSADGSLKIWDLAGTAMHFIALRGTFSGDGSRYTVFTNNTFEVRDTITGGRISLLQTGALPVQRAMLNRDGTVASAIMAEAAYNCQTNYMVQFWKIPEGGMLGPGLWISNALNGVAFSENGKRAVTWGGTNAQIWDITTGSEVAKLNNREPIGSALLDPAAERLLTVSSNIVQVWSLTTGAPLYPAFEHPVSVEHAEFSRDGRYIVTCCADRYIIPRFARIWNAATGRSVGNPLWHADGVLYASFSHDGSRVTTAGEDFKAAVWDTLTTRQLSLPMRHAHQVRAATFDPDAKWIATASSDRTARVWDPDTSEALTPPLRHLHPATDVTFLPDGLHLLTRDEEGGAFLWTLPMARTRSADLLELAEVLSGGAFVSAEGTGQRSKPSPASWQHLRAEFPRQFETSQDEIIRWHEFQAEDSELDQDWFAAGFHIRQLLRLRPNDAALLDRLAHATERLNTENDNNPGPTE